LGEQVGAEIFGVDVRDLADDDFAVIYQTWLDCNVICVRDQSLDAVEEFFAYSRRFGRLHEHPSKSTRHSEYPELTVLGTDKFNADGSLNEAVYARGGENWHTDGAYDEVSFKATQLYALAIPSTGGDTLFSSMYAAYGALPERLKDRIGERRGAFTYAGRSTRSAQLLNPEDRDWTPVMHPILRTHPETGRKGLYFDPGKIVAVEGLEESESDDLIDELKTYMIQPEGQYRHKWRKGDIVIWDNRCTYHKAAADYPPEEDRIHWRVSIKPE
jgi:taurine dioxygenase